MRLFQARHEHPLRRALWLAGSWLGLAVVTFVISQAVWRISDPSPRLVLGGDFVPAYSAGKLVREGRADQIYDQSVMSAVERQVVEEASLEPLPFYGPYLNPPWFAVACAPLAGLPYRTAAGVWLAVNLLCAAGAMALLCRMLPRPAGWRAWGLIPLLVIISMPFWQALCHLQNTCVSLLLVSAMVTCWHRWGGDRGKLLGGILCGLLFYKPQLASVLAAVMCVWQGWPALAGCVSTLAGLVVASAIELPGTLSEYVRSLPKALALIQSRPEYNWGRQVTPRGFWRLLIQGHSGGAEAPVVTVLTWGVMLCAGLLLAVCVWRSLKSRDDRPTVDRLIAATIAAMPLVMPYYMDYDLLLLALPATLLSADAMSGSRKVGRAVWAWAFLFLTLYVNPGLSGQTRVNLAAPLVAIVGGATMIHCVRREEQARAGTQGGVPLARAA